MGALTLPVMYAILTWHTPTLLVMTNAQQTCASVCCSMTKGLLGAVIKQHSLLQGALGVS